MIATATVTEFSVLRRCLRCGLTKPVDQFHLRRTRGDGLQTRCKKCVSQVHREWRERTGYSCVRPVCPSCKCLKKNPKAGYCGDCTKARNLVPARRRAIQERYFRTTYGIDYWDWALLFNSQDGKCAGCGARLRFDETTCVDHAHETGRVRGLLCRDCNLCLGNVRDNPGTLKRLVAYLEGPP